MTVLLSKRAINILLMLLDLEGSITTQELAENFTVSVRTIKYDLEDIRACLNSTMRHFIQNEIRESG